VIGDVSATLDLDDVDAARGELFLRKQQIFALGLPAEGDHRFVFDDDPGIALAPFAYCSMEPPLKLPHFAIRPHAEI
jgi:hypothetical protein